MRTLEGKVAVVTGAGRGIGLAVVERFIKEGASVVINDLDAEPAEAAAAAARAAGGQAIVVAGSISRRAFADEFIAAAMDEFGSLDIVVNNAGYATYASAEDTSDEDFDVVLDVLVSAPFRILRAAGRVFRQQAAGRGDVPSRKVVNISSIGGLSGAPGQIAYGAGKAGILGLTSTLAMEWGKYNVNVNAVAPGLTRTRLTEGPDVGISSITVEGKEHRLTGGAWPPESRIPLDDMGGMVALRRVGSPADLAGAIYMLSSPDADYITGQTLVVDGGLRPGR